MQTYRSEPLRILLTEGGSTSARETVTALGLAGHRIEICDPDPYCLARFSRFVSKFHRCPGLRVDPLGFLSFVEDLLSSGRFDVLLPIHEQGFLFARFRQRLPAVISVALPSFDSYRTVVSKAGFSRLLDELGLPQPSTQFVTSEADLRSVVRFPCVVKTAIGTASRGVWFIRDEAGLTSACRDLHSNEEFANGILVQEFIAGITEHAQAVFSHGELLGFHAFRQLATGAGGGDARKESVLRPNVREYVSKIGEKLAWHGALSVDWILPWTQSTPFFIDCNPRLVEPMSALLSGLDLVQLLLQVSQGLTPQPFLSSHEGVRTHLAMQAVLGCALRGGNRWEVACECARLLAHMKPYIDSIEELTPVRLDWMSAAPLLVTMALMLIAPERASTVARSGWGDHLLDTRSMAQIENAKLV